MECITPGHKTDLYFTTPSTGHADSQPGNTPKVLGIGAFDGRYSVFGYYETLSERNVAFENLTCDRAWSDTRVSWCKGLV